MVLICVLGVGAVLAVRLVVHVVGGVLISECLQCLIKPPAATQLTGGPGHYRLNVDPHHFTTMPPPRPTGSLCAVFYHFLLRMTT